MQPQFLKDELVEAARQAEPITTSDAKILLTQGGALFYTIRLLLEEQGNMQRLLSKTSLITQEGLHKALELQGTIRGFDRAIDIILELTETPNE